MSALPPKADIGTQSWNVRFVPKAHIAQPTVLRQPEVLGRGTALRYFSASTPSPETTNTLLPRSGGVATKLRTASATSWAVWGAFSPLMNSSGEMPRYLV